ncbi:hypothetical protein GGX14DRAFT_397281 [Mycena pura]|uniref:Uncharacterized protein n=1 Tax=Mycena pura TaxID=153505 RepID=A0AAD6Y8V0_9AGAR|nr:hypothetical protein GGX14DRAFT_397281 [Mycena pura]
MNGQKLATPGGIDEQRRAHLELLQCASDHENGVRWDRCKVDCKHCQAETSARKDGLTTEQSIQFPFLKPTNEHIACCTIGEGPSRREVGKVVRFQQAGEDVRGAPKVEAEDDFDGALRREPPPMVEHESPGAPATMPAGLISWADNVKPALRDGAWGVVCQLRRARQWGSVSVIGWRAAGDRRRAAGGRRRATDGGRVGQRAITMAKSNSKSTLDFPPTVTEGPPAVRRFGGSEVRRFAATTELPLEPLAQLHQPFQPSAQAPSSPASQGLLPPALGASSWSPGPSTSTPKPGHTTPKAPRGFSVFLASFGVSEPQRSELRRSRCSAIPLGDFGDSEVHSHSQTTSEALSALVFQGFLAFMCFDAAALRSLGNFSGSQPPLNLQGPWCLGVSMPWRFGALAVRRFGVSLFHSLSQVPESVVPQRLNISELQHFGASAFRVSKVVGLHPDPSELRPAFRSLRLNLRISDPLGLGLRGLSAPHALYPRTAFPQVYSDTWAWGFLTSFSKDSPLPSPLSLDCGKCQDQVADLLPALRSSQNTASIGASATQWAPGKGGLRGLPHTP